VVPCHGFHGVELLEHFTAHGTLNQLVKLQIAEESSNSGPGSFFLDEVGLDDTV
jgi:hypothetical protein